MLTRQQKSKQLDQITEKLNNSTSVIFATYRNVAITDFDTIRKELKQNKMNMKVVKNALLKRALATQNMELTEEQLSLPIVMAWSEGDEMLLPKTITNFNKTQENFKVLAGIFEQELIDSDTVAQLASLPGREELYAKVVGSVAAPLSRLVTAVNYPASALVRVLKQIETQKA